jgi:hypothetical protein
MPEPQWHVALAPAVYAVARKTRVPRPALAALASVVIDADHFADVTYFRVTGCRDRQIVPCHSWEVAIAGCFSKRPLTRAVAAGACAHLLADWLVGGYDFLQLSLIYRVARRFRTGRMGPWVEWPRGPRGWGEIFYSRDVRAHSEMTKTNSARSDRGRRSVDSPSRGVVGTTVPIGQVLPPSVKRNGPLDALGDLANVATERG